MKKSKRTMRRAILSGLFNHLEEHYEVGVSRETFVDGRLSMHQLDAILSFKTDPLLDELRSALDRLEVGTYGICLGCKREIPQEKLDAAPAVRVCDTCEKIFSHVSVHASLTT